MPKSVVPERLSWAVDRLQLSPGDDVLEIGCGRGVALALICEQLDTGSVLGVDRSATAIEGAQQRNQAAVDAGQLELTVASFEKADYRGRTFDRILAVNVNHFWVRSATKELELLKKLLTSDGRIHLAWEPPSPAKVDQIADTVGPLVEDSGFDVSVEIAQTKSGAALVAVVGTLH
ncbi:SAM-dependent methyltransferase [Micromonospora sp. LOL_021]|uniref:SAM-dependent methyltransferase n=1 Tax=Micromonospora sp. LOL_021 TaxID=3345417 RepID=UPI003A874D57